MGLVLSLLNRNVSMLQAISGVSLELYTGIPGHASTPCVSELFCPHQFPSRANPVRVEFAPLLCQVWRGKCTLSPEERGFCFAC